MRYKRRVKQDRHWYEEISLGLNKVIKIGKSYGITIPKRFIDKGDLSVGDEILLICMKRTRMVGDELTKREMKQFEELKKLKRREIDYLNKMYGEKEESDKP